MISEHGKSLLQELSMDIEKLASFMETVGHAISQEQPSFANRLWTESEMLRQFQIKISRVMRGGEENDR